MPKKVYKCLVCKAPTVAANKLCKKEACRDTRLKERLHIVPNAHSSGVFLSLTHCPHGKSLINPCALCEAEWRAAKKEVINED
jgi:hypothetical protein